MRISILYLLNYTYNHKKNNLILLCNLTVNLIIFLLINEYFIFLVQYSTNLKSNRKLCKNEKLLTILFF